MTPEQAMDMLIRATGLLTLTREDHIKLEAALKIVATAVNKASELGGPEDAKSADAPDPE